MQVEEIKLGWKALAIILNTIRRAVNSNDPVKGHGILLSETKSGTIISLDPKTSDDVEAQISAAISGVTSMTVNDVGWATVQTVDPVTCATNTVAVLTQSPGQSVVFSISLK